MESRVCAAKIIYNLIIGGGSDENTVVVDFVSADLIEAVTISLSQYFSKEELF